MNDLHLEYLTTLKQYLGGGDEAARSKAYELGRRSMVEGLGVLDMAVLHNAAVDTLAPDVPVSEQRRFANAAAPLFYELLAAFEMSLTGYRVASEELRKLNETLQTTLTELREAQTELVRKERLASLGRAAFSVSPLIDEQLKRIAIPPNVRLERHDTGSVEALADRTQMGQIVLTLLMNAVQAVGDKPGTVTVRVGHEPKAPAHVRIDVTDSGPGIAPENMEKLFDPSASPEARGSGPGLSVSRQLARENGGEIGVASELGVGSTFSLILPIAQVA